MPNGNPRACGPLVAWGNAYLRDLVSLDEAAEHAAGGRLLRVRGLRGAWSRAIGRPGSPWQAAGGTLRGTPGIADADATEDPDSVAVALGRLRTLGARGLRLVLPVPGDPAGLPPGVAGEALAFGEAIAVEGLPLVLLVEPPAAPASVGPGGAAPGALDHLEAITLRVVGVDRPVGPTSYLAEADRALRQETLAALAELDGAEVASWQVPGRVNGLGGGRPQLAPGYPPEAERLLASAERLGAAARVGLASIGGAIGPGPAARRAATLGRLERACRAAESAAYAGILERLVP